MKAMSSRAIAVTATFGLPTCGESAKAFAQPDLRLPSNVLDRFRQDVDPGLNGEGHLGWVARGPGRFDQGAPRAAVARLGDAPLSARRTARGLGRNQADKRGQLTRRREPGAVAELRDDGDGDEPLHTTQRLHRVDDRRQPPRGRPRAQFGLEPGESIDLLVDGLHRFLKRRSVAPASDTRPSRDTADARRPIGPTHIVQAEAQQERG